MNNDSLQLPNIEDIKDEFSRDYFDGRAPTLAQYVVLYPEFSEELTDFILKFAETVASSVEIAEPSELGHRALLRALWASHAKARTVTERMSELQVTEAALVKELRTPMEMFSLFHRTHVTSGADRFVRAVARALKLTELQSCRMLAPQALAYRSKGSPTPVTRSFRDLVEELHSKQLMTDEDYDFWMEEDSE